MAEPSNSCRAAGTCGGQRGGGPGCEGAAGLGCGGEALTASSGRRGQRREDLYNRPGSPYCPNLHPMSRTSGSLSAQGVLTGTVP